MTLYYKPGIAPQPLPFSDAEADGTAWTDLAHNPEGVVATGWIETPAQPSFDANSQALEWTGTAWEVVSRVPASVSRLQAKQALLAAGHLAAVKALVASSPENIQIYFADADPWHRDHAEVNTLGAALGLSSAQIDALFVAAAAIT
jgi:hypothetical protein